MNRIMVLGVSAGVGKSTFARQQGKILNIDVYHLDYYFWKPNWVQASIEEFSDSQRKIVAHDQWIIEGNYAPTYDIRAEKADTIIYLELPLRICLYRVFKRFFMNVGKSRPDMGEGCKEKIDYEFLKFIWTTYHPRKKKMAERLRDFQQIGPHKTVIMLKSKQEIQDFLKEMGKKID
ncbi:topology modulation protein [Filobacillus milosensis]|uniref:Topology modulation protein n=1 Tax=Filobacillus milosensis TaxID=94137 RepID=A0A4Y8IHQ2_9BACI|nr:topology modulation protein [Filobacillus milosensis]TFB14223.1 topology modulation protein [Filobacillus milosensis]